MGRHLLESGHELRIATYDRGLENLAEFDPVEIEGLHIATRDNRVSVAGTVLHNLGKLPRGYGKVRRLQREIREFQPHCLITDFEPMTAYLSGVYDIPLITLDNQHRIRFMEIPCPKELEKDRRLTLQVVRAMIPKPDVSLVTTFYFGKTKNERTFLFPPILRQEIRDLQTGQGDGIIVYLTQGFDSFIDSLQQYPDQRFLFYGYHDEKVLGNVHYKRFDWQGFLDDLANCKAIMGTAGYTLMTEAIHLGKPYLALPMKGQFEQHLNALLLDQLGYGRNGRPDGGAIRPEVVRAFLDEIPRFREKMINATRGDDNAGITSKLSELVADDAALAREYRERRRRNGSH